MKKNLMIALLTALSLSGAAQAGMICEGNATFGNKLKLTVSNDGTAHVSTGSSATAVEQDFKVDSVWDGHATGLITAPGLAVRYRNEYGCIRDAVVITNVRGGFVNFIETVQMTKCVNTDLEHDYCND